jgi:hypothetical protein
MDDFQKLLNGICNRPQMYTPHGDFSEIVAYITGYAAGRQHDKSFVEGNLFNFSVWMSERFGLAARNWIWWNVLLHAFDNDTSRALAGLPKLYEEFVAEGSPKAGSGPSLFSAE